MKKKSSLLITTALATALSITSMPLLALTSCGQNEWSKYFVKPSDQELNKVAGDDLTANYTLELKNDLSNGQTLSLSIYSQESTITGARVQISSRATVAGKRVSFSVTLVPPNNGQTCVTHFILKFTCKNGEQAVWESEPLSGFGLTTQLPDPIERHITCTTPNLSIVDDWDNYYIPSRNFNFKINEKIQSNYKFKASITQQEQTGGLYEEYDLAMVGCDEEIKIPAHGEPTLCVYFTSNEDKPTPLYSNYNDLNTQVTFGLKITCVETTSSGDEQERWSENIDSLTLTYKMQPFTGKSKGNEQTISRYASDEKYRTTDAHFYLINDLWAERWEPALLDIETGDIIDWQQFAESVEVHNVASLEEDKYMQLKIVWKKDYISSRTKGEQKKFYFAAKPVLSESPAPEPVFLCDIMCTITFD